MTAVTSVAEITVAAAVEPWQAIGLRVVDGSSWVGGVRLRFVPPTEAEGVVGWVLSAPTAPASTAPRPSAIDGLATTWTGEVEPETWEHDLGATAFDHLVVMTSSLERTCGAIESATGEPLKRVREAGPVRQGFHRLGPVIVEVVESSRVVADVAAFWGFVLVVDDIHDVADRLGPDMLSLPKPAVQPGRLIASFRAGVGLGLPLAIMSA